MGGWFFLAAAITLAAPQGSGQAPAAPIAVPAPPPVVPAVVLAPIPADGEIERFLKEADVVSTKSTKKGVTDSLRATLSDGKLTHDAHIQNIDETKREFRTNQGVEFDFRDSWTFNVAAYKIDRLIGLNMVPPSISRTHRSTPAAFTWWIDDVLMDEGDKVKNKVEAPDRNYYLPPAGDDVSLRRAHLQRRSQPGQHRLHQGLAALADRSHAGVPQEHDAQGAGAASRAATARCSKVSRRSIARS